MSEDLEFGRLMDELWAGTDEERFAWLELAARDPATRARVVEAHRLLSSRHGPSSGHTRFAPETALALSRGAVFREAILDPAELDWLIASLTPVDAPGSETVSPATARRLRSLTRPAPSRRRRFVGPGLLAAAAAVILFLQMPGAAPWNERIGASRWRILRLSEEFEAAVRDSVAGETDPALFDVPRAASRVTRRAGSEPVEAVHPRWEAVTDLRPAFEWSGAAEGRYELLLVDRDRRLVWSTEVAGTGVVCPERLDPGSRYHWKVNRLGESELVSSGYTAFLVLDESTRRRLAADLGQAGDVAYLRGVAFERAGLYRSALRSFEKADADDAVHRIRRKQGLGP